MPSPAAYEVREAHWPQDIPHLRHVREDVFVREQAVPLELEWDDEDPGCKHVLAVNAEGEAIGTGRLQADGKIGRMAVLARYRDRGVGAAMLRGLIDQARASGLSRVYLYAQVGAKGFYARHGFVPRGEEFIEAGIAHIEMTLELHDG